MRIKLFIATLAVSLCTIASAETFDGPRISFRAGIAGSPNTGVDYFCENTGIYAYNLAGIYGDYHGPTKSSGLITAEVDFALSSWFTLGINFGITHFAHDAYNGITQKLTKHRKGNALYALPTATFNYYNKQALKLYGSFGFGIGKYAGFDNLENRNFKLEAQCIPLGIEYGKKIFVFGELGFGTLYSGGRIGAGYRF